MGDELDDVAAATRFSGVVRVDRGGDRCSAPSGWPTAAARCRIPSAPASRSRAARRASRRSSVMSLVEDGTLALDTTARSVLGDDLPLIDGAVTVEHLLAHRSGIGDYLDEDAMTDVNDVPDARARPRARRRPRTTSRCSTGTRRSVAARRAVRLQQRRLRRARADRRAGERRPVPRPRARAGVRAGGHARHRRSCDRTSCPAMRPSATSDRRAAHQRLPPPGARHRRRRDRTRRPPTSRGFWEALFAGRIVSSSRVAEMVAPRSEAVTGGATGSVSGSRRQAPRSCSSARTPGPRSTRGTTRRPTSTATVMANVTDGAWDMADALDRLLTL